MSKVYLVTDSSGAQRLIAADKRSEVEDKILAGYTIRTADTLDAYKAAQAGVEIEQALDAEPSAA
jgi:hypothetical protein